MISFDNETQRSNVIACINMAAGTMKPEASDSYLAQISTLVQLRRDVEAACIAEQPAEQLSDVARTL